MEAPAPFVEKSAVNPFMGAVACLLIVVVVIALVSSSVVTNNRISALQTKVNTPICGSGTLSVCGTGTSTVNQIPIFKNDTSNLIGASLWTLPATDGTVGQLLQTNGAGALSFSGNLIDTATHIVDVGTGTKRLDFNMIGGTSGTGTTIETTQTTNRNFILPDVDGLAVVSRTTPADGRVLIGANNVDLFNSTAKLQLTAYNNSDGPPPAPSPLYSSAQFRGNQYGNSAAAPGLSFFKSRGPITDVVANLVPVLVGDHTMDISAVGVSPPGGQPITGQMSFIVSSVPVAPPGPAGWIGTDFQLQLTSKNGPQNGRRSVFRVSSEAIPQLRESTSAGSGQPASGVVTLVGGTFTVANTTLPANARILLTVQPGTVPAGQIYVSAIVANTSFTITSTNAGDTCTVYYQIWQPIA